eukprot:gene5937-biopygen7519
MSSSIASTFLMSAVPRFAVRTTSSPSSSSRVAPSRSPPALPARAVAAVAADAVVPCIAPCAARMRMCRKQRHQSWGRRLMPMGRKWGEALGLPTVA